ncbi:MAG: hypothetical protein JWM10_4938 [Myxococcaceae bacterium]|nr:hypothetical protein [Myxococcaceae bacterium]
MSPPLTLARWLWPDSVADDDRWALWRERAWRLTVAALVVGFALAGARELRLLLRPELAKTAAWQLSSTQGPGPAAGRGFDATSEGLPNIFFQTLTEPNPWIEFDLGAPRDVAMIRVTNRLDCCRDWASPLVAEVSLDHTRWVEVARKVEAFDTWRAVFPEQRGRYVRLRVPRPTQLQLSWVEIR